MAGAVGVRRAVRLDATPDRLAAEANLAVTTLGVGGAAVAAVAAATSEVVDVAVAVRLLGAVAVLGAAVALRIAAVAGVGPRQRAPAGDG
ncbi:MAG TPA: hypothetical protein ENK57_21835 [Polyangiaceae bacterium]|nr:hypothetical protein [Polyangiaceae bacterium]